MIARLRCRLRHCGCSILCFYSRHLQNDIRFLRISIDPLRYGNLKTTVLFVIKPQSDNNAFARQCDHVRTINYVFANHFSLFCLEILSGIAMLQYSRTVAQCLRIEWRGWQDEFDAPKWGELAAPPVKRLRQMEAFRIVMPLDFHYPCAGGAASSPHFCSANFALEY
jgi:hypothetical protein